MSFWYHCLTLQYFQSENNLYMVHAVNCPVNDRWSMDNVEKDTRNIVLIISSSGCLYYFWHTGGYGFDCPIHIVIQIIIWSLGKILICFIVHISSYLLHHRWALCCPLWSESGCSSDHQTSQHPLQCQRCNRVKISLPFMPRIWWNWQTIW